MTRYTVVWHQGAQDELAELWMSAGDRSAVTAAANIIDARLSEDATTQGVEISEGLRALVVPPLRTLFTVDEGDRIVEVLRIKSF